MELHRRIEYEGKTIHYRDEGRGNQHVLVLLHGFLQNLDVWSSFTLTYMRYMRVISVDLPGHGYSSTYGDVHTMEFMAKAVKAVLDEAGVEKCVMVGHSMGGYVALAFADLYPYMLKGLGLMHSHAMADSEVGRRKRLAICEQVHVNRASFIVNFIPELFFEGNRLPMAAEIKDLQDQCLETSEPAIKAAQRGMLQRPSRLDLLQNLHMPVLFILGKNDPRLEFEMGVSQAMIPPIAEVFMLDKVGHMSLIEAKELVKTRIKAFVATCYN